MLSGIGDSSALSALGIDTIVDLPDVGQNLQDHTAVTLQWTVNADFTLDDVANNQTLTDEDLAEWESSKSGTFASCGALNIVFARLPDDATIFESMSDPSAGSNAAHYELIFQASHSF